MLCKNISDTVATIDIDTVPGRPPMRLRVAPGQEVEVADGYCEPVAGASPARKRDPIIVMLSAGRLRPQPGRYAPGYSAETYGREAALSQAGGVAATQAHMADMMAAMRAEMASLLRDRDEAAAERTRDLESELEALRAENAALRKGGGLAEDDAEPDFVIEVEGDPDRFVADLAASQPGSDVIEVPPGVVAPAPEPPAPGELSSLTRKELVNLARAAGVKDISGKNKDQLAAAIAEAQG